MICEKEEGGDRNCSLSIVISAAAARLRRKGEKKQKRDR